MNSLPLISRRRHYFYVLVFSIAAWLFVAELIGGFKPSYIKTRLCGCGWHYIYRNISFLIFGAGGILWGFIFSFVLNRWMFVAYSKPGDKHVPFSWMARWGKAFLGWYGLVILLVVSGIYMAGDYITHTCFKMHLNDKRRQEIGRPKLHCAAANGHKAVAELLIAKGADVNAKDIIDKMPLHLAADRGRKTVAELLIAKGAKVNAKDISGMTPLDWAITYRQNKVAALLRSHGGKTGEELKKEAGK